MKSVETDGFAPKLTAESIAARMVGVRRGRARREVTPGTRLRVRHAQYDVGWAWLLVRFR